MSLNIFNKPELEKICAAFGEDKASKVQVMIDALEAQGVDAEAVYEQFPDLKEKYDGSENETPHQSLDLSDTRKHQDEVLVVASSELEEQDIVPSKKYLIKMTRKNPRFDVAGHTFTTDAPFAIMEPDLAQYVLDNEEGFRLASPVEVKEYYEGS